MPEETLTPEEIKALKEFAQNMMAAGRMRRLLTTAVLWLASVLGAGYFVYKFILGKGG